MPGELRTRELIGDTFVVTHTIDDSSDGWRADNFLKKTYKHFSRNRLQSYIDEGRVVIERACTTTRQRLKASTTLRVGDHLKILTARTEEPPVNMNWGVLYEDDHILVIDKPGNLPVHPAGKFLFHTLLMQLRTERGRTYHLIHRLDRETSGVLLLAKDPETAGSLVKQFRVRQTVKRYYAVAEGHPKEDEFSVNLEIGKAEGSDIRLKMQAYPNGTGYLPSLTHFKVVQRSPKNVSLIDCQLETGRQHQIRVHLSQAGHAVVGDKLYGPDDRIFLDHIHRAQWVQAKLAKRGIKISDEATELEDEDQNDDDGDTGLKRHALHSRYLRFFYERTGKWLEIEAPLPADMKGLL